MRVVDDWQFKKKMDMKFNVIEIVNVLIVIGLLNLIARKRDVTMLLLVLFVCGTLHFSYAAIALATNESSNLQITQHTEGGGALAKLATFSLLSLVFTLLGVRAYKVIAACQRVDINIVKWILLAMGAVFVGYILNIRSFDWLQLKNVISVEAMLALLMIGFLGVSNEKTIYLAKIYSWALASLLIFGAIDCIAIYEVFVQQSWASTFQSSGEKVFRASSVLFNPNLFAFWASLIYLGCAYGMHSFKAHQNMMLCGMILASIAIYFSGSRTAGFLLFGVLFVAALLNKDRPRWTPFLVLPLIMFSIYALSAWLIGPLIPGGGGWHEIALLGERFAAAPVYLANYVFGLAGVPVEIKISIEGRIFGEGRDAGWLVLYQDVGWLGLSVTALASGMLVAWGVRAYVAHSSPASVYALSTLAYCLLTAFVMRFQIFPVWLFMGIAFVVCISFWRKLTLPTLRIRT